MLTVSSLSGLGIWAGALLAITLGGCQSGFSPSSISREPLSVQGAGATFPAPLYRRWMQEFTQNRAYETVSLTYDSVGSGQGIKRYLAESVDFGASDAPLTAEEHRNYPASRGKILQLPMTGGLVVFSYNLAEIEGADHLKLSRASYCGIVTGEVKSWNDPQIIADNPGLNLPASPILFVRRSDSSGTTYIFTRHLQAACPNWRAGAGKSVQWPFGIGAAGNEGVSAEIQQSSGTIGYIEYSYARQKRLPIAALENRSGTFVVPTPESATEAFDGVAVPEDFVLEIPDPEGTNVYPIVGLTWLLLYGQYDNPDTQKVLQDFVRWSLTRGKPYALEMGYLPLPEGLQKQVFASLESP